MADSESTPKIVLGGSLVGHSEVRSACFEAGCPFPSRPGPAGGTYMGDCLRQVHCHGGRLAVQGVVGECHQAQLVLGVELAVDHDSAMCFALLGPIPLEMVGL